MTTPVDLDDPWLSALPLASAEIVVERLFEAFHELRLENPAKYHFGMSEVPLTTRLGIRLQNSAHAAPIGFWKYEDRTNRRDEGDPRRLDITFSTVVADQSAVTLVFECKKMREAPSGKGDRAQYIKEGVRRFVQGSYAPREPIGFMVPFVQGAPRAVFTSLKRAFAAPDIDILLGLTPYPSGEVWEEPPKRFQRAHLSTRHQRAILTPPITNEITIYHVPLCFP